ncbi:MAG TPA: tryptophan-rich sensory protein, partial [Myxococcota bacterium]
MSTAHKDIARQVINVLGIGGGIALNAIVPRVGDDVGEVSRRVEPMLSAAGWAFAIWGVIFLSTAAFAVWQALPAQRTSSLLRRVGVWPAVNGIGGGLWVLAFTHQHFVLAVAIMLVILGSLIMVERRSVGAVGFEHGLVRVPFGLNLGWICVATVLNVAQTLHWLGWNGAPASPLFWSMLVVVVAGAIGAALVLLRRQRAAGVAVVWGLAGVVSAQRGSVDTLAWCA